MNIGNKSSFKDTAFIVCFGLVIFALYIVNNNQKELAQAYQSFLPSVIAQQQQGQEVKVIERVVSQQPWAAVQDKARDTVVQVVAQTAEVNILQPYKAPQQNVHLGSAFFINKEGYLITNAHVIDEAQSIWIKIPSLGKAIIDVEIVGKSPERDLALLKPTPEGLKLIQERLKTVPFLPLGNSDDVHRVDEVLTLGYPLGQASVKSTSGVVSGREHIGGYHLIQISSPVNPGSSGGPALNLRGEVVGITCSGIPSAQNVGYIIPVNELKLILPDLHKNRLLRRPFLGVVFNHGSTELAQYLKNPIPSGCYVVDVYNGSPLFKAGIKAGDMIYEINDIRLDEYGDLTVSWSEDKLSVFDYVSRLEVGKPIKMVIYRNGVRKEISFKFEHTELAPVHKIFLGEDAIDYEIFGGMLLQELTLNHLPILVNNAPSLAKYADFKNQMEAALIVTHIVPNSQMQRMDIVREGAIIAQVNDTPVKTLKDFRKALQAALKNDLISFKTSDGVFFVLSRDKILKDERKLAQLFHYPLSSLMQTTLAQYEKKQETVQA